MGLLSSITSGLQKAAQTTIGKAVVSGLDTLSAVYQNPITTITKGVGAAKEIYEKDTTAQKTAKTLSTAITSVTAVLSGSAVAAAAKTGGVPGLTKLANSVLPTTTKGKIVAAAGTAIAAGALVSQPVKTLTTIEQAPSQLAQFGSGIANFVANPTAESAKELVKESPLLTAGTALLVAGPALGGIAVGAGRVAAAVIDKEPQTLDFTPQTYTIKELQDVVSQPVAAATTPITPQTSTVSQGTAKKKRKKTKKKPQISNISQKVNVLINNKNTAKYINKGAIIV